MDAHARRLKAEMVVEKRTESAILLTRTLIQGVFFEPATLAFMTFYEMTAEELQDKVAEFMEYLDKTAPEEEG